VYRSGTESGIGWRWEEDGRKEQDEKNDDHKDDDNDDDFQGSPVREYAPDAD